MARRRSQSIVERVNWSILGLGVLCVVVFGSGAAWSGMELLRNSRFRTGIHCKATIVSSKTTKTPPSREHPLGGYVTRFEYEFKPEGSAETYRNSGSNFSEIDPDSGPAMPASADKSKVREVENIYLPKNPEMNMLARDARAGAGSAGMIFGLCLVAAVVTGLLFILGAFLGKKEFEPY